MRKRRTPSAVRSAMSSSNVGPTQGSGVRPALWYPSVYCRMPAAAATACAVAGAGVDDANGYAVRRKHYQLILGRLSGADSFGKRTDEQGMRAERGDGVELRANRQRGDRRVDILLHAYA